MWFSDDAQVPVGGCTIPGLVRAAADEHGDRAALVDGPTGISVDYRELVRRVDRIAAWLAADGFRAGDRLALWAPNTPPWAAFCLGALQAGGAVTTVNPAAAEREVALQVGDAGASVVVTVPASVPAALGLGVRRVVVLGEADGAVPLAEVLGCAAPAVRCDDDPHDVALLPCSSGTTGLPKVVMLTHDNLVTGARQVARALGVTAADTTLAVAPWFHSLGLTAELLVPLASGATVVSLPRFEPAAFLDALEYHRVTYLAVPPPVAAFLARSPEVPRRDLSSLQLLGVGGAPLPVALQDELAQRLPGCAIGQGWGLTETSGTLSVPRRGTGSRPGTVGRLLPNTALRVVDPTTGCDVDDDGELWVRGPQVMAGYLGRPGATAEMIDDDGWLHTGDVGHVDPDGSVVIVDRLKELIKVNAFQVAPAELESLLLAHTAVADAAVIRRPDARTGEAPVALVVARPGADVDPDEIKGWLAARVAPYKRLREVHVVDALPRTPSGKLLRRLLTEEPALA
jgi:acyl-CoA synthetase (AMP-forming)/AMP-acid ligase II